MALVTMDNDGLNRLAHETVLGEDAMSAALEFRAKTEGCGVVHHAPVCLACAVMTFL